MSEFLKWWGFLLAIVLGVSVWCAGLAIGAWLIPAHTAQPWTAVLSVSYVAVYATGSLAAAMTKADG